MTIRQFIQLANTDVGYNPELKAQFHQESAKILRKLAKLLGYEKGDFDLRHNQGGIAVSGEITLHSDRLYIQFSQYCLGASHGFMWRTCKGRKDYTGGQNQWVKWESLTDLATIAVRMLAFVNRDRLLETVN